MQKDQHLHLRLDLLVQSLQLVHVGLLSRPATAHTFLLIGLGDLCNVSVYRSSSWRNREPIWKNLTMWKWTYSMRMISNCHLIARDWYELTWSTTWCAIRPLFCRILKSVAPLALAIFFATGYVNKGVGLARSLKDLGGWTRERPVDILFCILNFLSRRAHVLDAFLSSW